MTTDIQKEDGFTVFIDPRTFNWNAWNADTGVASGTCTRGGRARIVRHAMRNRFVESARSRQRNSIHREDRTMNRFLGAIALACLLTTAAFASETADDSGAADERAGDPAYAELRAELMAMYEKDQAARRQLLELLPEGSAKVGATGGGLKLENPTMEQIGIIMNVKAVELETTTFIKGVLDEHGFPGRSMVGDDGAHAAWILIQHADADRALQQRALALMEPMVETGEVDPSDYAHLVDRVLLARGEKQRFGTQFATDGDGVLRPRPTEDPETLDQRREAHGLLPMARHVELLAQELDVETGTVPLAAD